jgi:hypothetical protein
MVLYQGQSKWTAPPDLRGLLKEIRSIASEDKLRELHRAAIQAADIEDFSQSL